MGNVSANTSTYRPTREPMFTETMQNLREYGQPVERSWRLAVATPKFEDMVAAQAKQGNNLVLSGTFSGAKVAYLPTDRDLKVIIEIFSGTRVVEEKPDGKTHHWRT